MSSLMHFDWDRAKTAQALNLVDHMTTTSAPGRQSRWPPRRCRVTRRRRRGRALAVQLRPMVRRLKLNEIRGVAELRATAFGTKSAAPGQIEAVTAILSEHLALGDFACFVVEEAGEVLSCGIGMIHQRLPADHNPSGRWGYIQSMETHPLHRRRGHGHAVLRALQKWYREQAVPAVTLVATAMGEPMYRAAGFDEERFGAAMIWIDARGKSL